MRYQRTRKRPAVAVIAPSVVSIAGARKLKTPHYTQELVDRGILKVRIASFLLSQCGTRSLRVIVAGIENNVIVQRCQFAVQTRPHLLRIASGKIDTAARVDEQRISRYEVVLNQEALGTRSVARGVQEPDRKLSDTKFFADADGVIIA